MDTFYMSSELFEILNKNQKDAYGTVRSNCINLLDSFAMKKLKGGEVRAWKKDGTSVER